MAPLNWLFGKAVRKIDGDEKSLYLTFDDGPAIETEAVLDLLAKHRAHATFFLIAETARRNCAVVRRILGEGHSIGNHSLDHRYENFLNNRKKLKSWIADAEHALQDLTGKPTVGFRPPAGVRTPLLASILRELDTPMILWSTRFYDAVLPWTEAKALKSLRQAEGGEIILLHDRQRPANASRFLQTLDFYLTEAKKKGFRFERIESHNLLN